MGCCSPRFPHGPLRRDGVHLQVQATEVPGTQSRVMQEKTLSSSTFGKFQENLWEHFFLYGFVGSELNQLSVLAVFSFLRKPTTKPTTVIFPVSSKQQPDCCQKPEQCGVTDTSSFVLTLLSSVSLKGKWTEKHIQRYKSPQPLRSEMGEEPCWEIPRGTWCCLFSPDLIHQWEKQAGKLQ